MGYNKKYNCTYPTNKQQNDHMTKRQSENLVRCKTNKAENWFYKKLNKTKYKWKRQARWGTRIYDFWCHTIGIAVEIDGWSHNKEYDAKHDKYNYEVSGIKVIRVRNFNENDALNALKEIDTACTWNERRLSLNLKAIKL